MTLPGKNKPVLGITCGDLNSIGLELIIKTFSDARMLDFCTPVIFASQKSFQYYRKLLGDNPLNFQCIKDFSKLNPKQINVFNCWEEEVVISPGMINEIGGKYAARSLGVALQCLKDHEIEGLVTCPIHKKNIQSLDFKHTGHTPYLKEAFGAKEVVMLMTSENMRVALVTEHIPLSQVASQITKEGIWSKIQVLRESLIKDFGVGEPKIAVLGLNPHAGDEGLIGDEEKQIILPAISHARQNNIFCFGPFPSDGFFARHKYNQFDAVLAMYHDQGLIPFKSLSAGHGVNFTAGLPIVRTSPDHGTAFDIAGKNIADESSFRQAIFTCLDILEQRSTYAENTRNPLKKSELIKES
ncbi:MAG: 4-hydroxythreonine-4-phosphate dehydrogenase PdxA [Chitinophagaceae bacterium]